MSFSFPLPRIPDNIHNYQFIKDLGYGALFSTSVHNFTQLPDEHLIWLHTISKYHTNDASLKDVQTCLLLSNLRIIWIDKQTFQYSIGYDAIANIEYSKGRALGKDAMTISLKSAQAYNPQYTTNLPLQSIDSGEHKLLLSDKNILTFAIEFINAILKFRFDQVQQRNTQGHLVGALSSFYTPPGIMKMFSIPLSLGIYSPQQFIPFIPSTTSSSLSSTTTTRNKSTSISSQYKITTPNLISDDKIDSTTNNQTDMLLYVTSQVRQMLSEQLVCVEDEMNQAALLKHCWLTYTINIIGNIDQPNTHTGTRQGKHVKWRRKFSEPVLVPGLAMRKTQLIDPTITSSSSSTTISSSSSFSQQPSTRSRSTVQTNPFGDEMSLARPRGTATTNTTSTSTTSTTSIQNKNDTNPFIITNKSPIIHFTNPLSFNYTDLHPTTALTFTVSLTITLHTIQGVRTILQEHQLNPTSDIVEQLKEVTTSSLPFEHEPVKLSSISVEIGRTSVPFEQFVPIPFLQLSIPIAIVDENILQQLQIIKEQSLQHHNQQIDDFINTQSEQLTQTKLASIKQSPTIQSNADKRRNTIDNSSVRDSTQQDMQILLLNTQILEQFQQDPEMFKNTLTPTVEFVLDIDTSTTNNTNNTSRDDKTTLATIALTSNPFDDDDDDEDDEVHKAMIDSDDDIVLPTSHLIEKDKDVVVDSSIDVVDDSTTTVTEKQPDDQNNEPITTNNNTDSTLQIEDSDTTTITDTTPTTTTDTTTTTTTTPDVSNTKLLPNDESNSIEPENTDTSTNTNTNTNSMDEKSTLNPFGDEDDNDQDDDTINNRNEPSQSVVIHPEPIIEIQPTSSSTTSTTTTLPLPTNDEIIITPLPIPEPPAPTTTKVHQDIPIVKFSTRLTKKFTRHTETPELSTTATPPLTPSNDTSLGSTITNLDNDKTNFDPFKDKAIHQQTIPIRHAPFGFETLIKQQEQMLLTQSQPRNRAESVGNNSNNNNNNNQLMSYDDFIYEFQRFDPKTNTWSTPFLPRDPYRYSDSANGEVYKSMDDVKCPTPWWKWSNQWSATMDSELLASLQVELKEYERDPNAIQNSAISGLTQLLLDFSLISQATTPSSSSNRTSSVPTPESNAKTSNSSSSLLPIVESTNSSDGPSSNIKNASFNTTTATTTTKKGRGLFGKLKASSKQTIEEPETHSTVTTVPLDDLPPSTPSTSTPTTTTINDSPAPNSIPHRPRVISQFGTYASSNYERFANVIDEDAPKELPSPFGNKNSKDHKKGQVEVDIPPETYLQDLINRSLAETLFSANTLLLAIPHRGIQYFSPQQFIPTPTTGSDFGTNFLKKAFNKTSHNAESFQTNKDHNFLIYNQILSESLSHCSIKRQTGEFYTMKGHICDMTWQYAPQPPEAIISESKDKKKGTIEQTIQPSYKMSEFDWSNIWYPGCVVRRRIWVRTRLYTGPHNPSCQCEFCQSMELSFMQSTDSRNIDAQSKIITNNHDIDNMLKLYTPAIHKVQLQLLELYIAAITSEIYNQMTRADRDLLSVPIKQPCTLQLPSQMTAQTLPLLVGINWIDIVRKMNIIETILTHDRRYSTEILPLLREFVSSGGNVQTTAQLNENNNDGQVVQSTRRNRPSLYQRPQTTKRNNNNNNNNNNTNNNDQEEDENGILLHWISPTLWAQYHNLLSFLFPSVSMALTQYLPFIDTRYIQKCLGADINPKSLVTYIIDFNELKSNQDLIASSDGGSDSDDHEDTNPFTANGGELSELTLDDFHSDITPLSTKPTNPFDDESNIERKRQNRSQKQKEIQEGLKEFNRHLQAASIAHQHAKELCILLETYAKRARIINKDIHKNQVRERRLSSTHSQQHPPTQHHHHQPIPEPTPTPPVVTLSLMCPYQQQVSQYHTPPKLSPELSSLGIGSDKAIPSPQSLISQISSVFISTLCAAYDLTFNPTTPPLYALPVVAMQGKAIVPPGYSVYAPQDLQKMESDIAENKQITQPQPMGIYTLCNCSNSVCIDAKIRGLIHTHHQHHAMDTINTTTNTTTTNNQPSTPSLTTTLLNRATGVTQPTTTTTTSTPTTNTTNSNIGGIYTNYTGCSKCVQFAPQYCKTATSETFGLNSILQQWPRRLTYLRNFLPIVKYVEDIGVIPKSWGLTTLVIKAITFINTYHFTTACVMSNILEPLYVFQPTIALNISVAYKNFNQLIQPTTNIKAPPSNPEEPEYIFPGSINHNFGGAIYQHPMTQFAAKPLLTNFQIFQHCYSPKQVKALTNNTHPQQLLASLQQISTQIDLLTPTTTYLAQFKQPMNFLTFTQALLHTIEQHHILGRKSRNFHIIKTHLLSYLTQSQQGLSGAPSMAQLNGIINELLGISFLEATYLRTNAFIQSIAAKFNHPIPIRLDLPFHHYFYLIRKELVTTMMANIKTFMLNEIFVTNPIVLHPPQINAYLHTQNNIHDLLNEPNTTFISEDDFNKPLDLHQFNSTLIKFNNPTSYKFYMPPSISQQLQPSVKTPYFNHPLVSLLPLSPFDPHEVIHHNSHVIQDPTAPLQPPTPTIGPKPQQQQQPTQALQPTVWQPLSSTNLLYPVLKNTAINVLHCLGLISTEQHELCIENNDKKISTDSNNNNNNKELSTYDGTIRSIQQMLLSTTNINNIPKELSTFRPHTTTSSIQSIGVLQSVEYIFIYAKKQYQKISLLLQHHPIMLSMVCYDLLTCFDVYYCYLFHLLAAPHAQPLPIPTISRLCAIVQQPQNVLYNGTIDGIHASTINPNVAHQIQNTQANNSGGGFFSNLISTAIGKDIQTTNNIQQQGNKGWLDYFQSKGKQLQQSLLTIVGDNEVITQLTQPTNLPPGQPMPHNLDLSGYSYWWLQFQQHPQNATNNNGTPLGPVRTIEYQYPTIFPTFTAQSSIDDFFNGDAFNPLQHQKQLETAQYKSIVHPTSPYFNLHHYTLSMTHTLSSITPYATPLSFALQSLAKTGLVQRVTNDKGMSEIDSDLRNQSHAQLQRSIAPRGVLIYDTIPFETSVNIALTADRFITSFETLIQFVSMSLEPINRLLAEYSTHLPPSRDENGNIIDHTLDAHPVTAGPIGIAVQMLTSHNSSAGTTLNDGYTRYLNDLQSESINSISQLKTHSLSILNGLLDNMERLRMTAINQTLTILIPQLALCLGNVPTLIKQQYSKCLGHNDTFYDILASQLDHTSKFGHNDKVSIHKNLLAPLLFIPKQITTLQQQQTNRTTGLFANSHLFKQHIQIISPYEETSFNIDFISKYYKFHEKLNKLKSNNNINPNLPTKTQVAPDMMSQMKRKQSFGGGDVLSNPFDDQSDDDDQMFSSYLSKYKETFGTHQEQNDDFDPFQDQTDLTARIFGNETKERMDNMNAQQERKKTQRAEQLAQNRDKRKQEQLSKQQQQQQQKDAVKRKGSLVNADDFFGNDDEPTNTTTNPFDDDDDDDNNDNGNTGHNPSQDPAAEQDDDVFDLNDPLLAYYASFGMFDGEGEEEDIDVDEDIEIGGNPFDDDIDEDNNDENSTIDTNDLTQTLNKKPLDLSKLGDIEDDNDDTNIQLQKNDDKSIQSIEPKQQQSLNESNPSLTASAIIDSFLDEDEVVEVGKSSSNTTQSTPTTQIVLTATTTYGLPLELSYIIDNIYSLSIENASAPPILKNGYTPYDLAHNVVLPSEFIKHLIGALFGLDTSSIISTIQTTNSQSSSQSRQQVTPMPNISLITVLSLFQDRQELFNVLIKNVCSSIIYPLLIASYGEYIPFNLKSIPLPPPPLNNETNSTPTSKINFMAIDTQYLCNHIPFELRNPALLTPPLQQIISDFSVIYTILPVLTTLDHTRLPPLLFTIPLSNQQENTGNTALATTTKYDIIDYYTTLQKSIGIDSLNPPSNLTLTFKERQALKSQDRIKKIWAQTVQSQEVLPRLGAWIGYCCGFLDLLNQLHVNLVTFLPSTTEMNVLLDLPIHASLPGSTTTIPQLASNLQIRLDLLDLLKFNTQQLKNNTNDNDSKPKSLLSPQDQSTIAQHLRSHLLFLFYVLHLCKITPNALQWCCILMNHTTPTAYLLANLYIQHAPHDAQPVWVKY